MVDLSTFIEITLQKPDDFNKIRETLSRIGVASQDEKILYQSCHILHKRGKYYITHFKEMFLLDGKPSNLSETDIARRNTIAKLLEEWGLCVIINKAALEPVAPVQHIRILTFKDKPDWKLVPKYTIGKKGMV